MRAVKTLNITTVVMLIRSQEKREKNMSRKSDKKRRRKRCFKPRSVLLPFTSLSEKSIACMRCFDSAYCAVIEKWRSRHDLYTRRNLMEPRGKYTAEISTSFFSTM